MTTHREPIRSGGLGEAAQSRGGVRQMGRNQIPLRHEFIVQVSHGGPYRDVQVAAEATAIGTFREFVEQLRAPITGVRILDFKGNVVREETA